MLRSLYRNPNKKVLTFSLVQLKFRYFYEPIDRPTPLRVQGPKQKQLFDVDKFFTFKLFSGSWHIG